MVWVFGLKWRSDQLIVTVCLFVVRLMALFSITSHVNASDPAGHPHETVEWINWL